MKSILEMSEDELEELDSIFLNKYYTEEGRLEEIELDYNNLKILVLRERIDELEEIFPFLKNWDAFYAIASAEAQDAYCRRDLLTKQLKELEG